MLTHLIPALTRLHTIPQTRFTRIPAQYRLPPLGDELADIVPDSPYRKESPTFDEIVRSIRQRIDHAEDLPHRASLEMAAADWLYNLVRRNVRRGRVFELQRVLTERRADCLGFARFFDLVGNDLGLDTGVAEVIIDNAGRYVPHFVNVLRLSDGQTRFIDAWYGSNDIMHRRIGLQVNMNGNWIMMDVDHDRLTSFSNIKGIPPRCVSATAVFMIGNRHLEKGLLQSDDEELDEALKNYDTALTLYPENPRFYFNRAVLFDQKGYADKATRDYSFALASEEALIRVLAREHEEVTNLMALDERGIGLGDQDLYLLNKGFVTGKPVPVEEIARQALLPADRVQEVLAEVESTLQST
jgi:tetratricopeptide (TPR) repeat protein